MDELTGVATVWVEVEKKDAITFESKYYLKDDGRKW